MRWARPATTGAAAFLFDSAKTYSGARYCTGTRRRHSNWERRHGLRRLKHVADRADHEPRQSVVTQFECNIVIPGRGTARVPRIQHQDALQNVESTCVSRFRVPPGACPWAARSADPGGGPGMTTSPAILKRRHYPPVAVLDNRALHCGKLIASALATCTWLTLNGRLNKPPS